MSSVYEMIGAGLITYLAFWQKDMILYAMSGIIIIILASNWMVDYPGVTVTCWFLGVYQVWKFIAMAMESGGGASGFQKLKAMFSRGRQDE